MKKLIFIILSLTFVNAIGQNQIQVKKANITDQIIYKGDSLGVWEDSAGTMYSRNSGYLQFQNTYIKAPNLTAPAGKYSKVLVYDAAGYIVPQPMSEFRDTLQVYTVADGNYGKEGVIDVGSRAEQYADFSDAVAAASTKDVIEVSNATFTESGTITMPQGSTLKIYEGGIISGNVEIIGNNTKLYAGILQCFDTTVTISGTWDIDEVPVTWFGAKNDSTEAVLTNRAVQKAIALSHIANNKVYFPAGTYIKRYDGTEWGWQLYPNTEIYGKGNVRIYVEYVSGQKNFAFGFPGYTISTNTLDSANAYIHDLKIYGLDGGMISGLSETNPTEGCGAIRFWSLYNKIRIENIEAYNMSLEAILVWNAQECIIRNCKVSNCNFDAYNPATIRKLIFQNNIADSVVFGLEFTGNYSSITEDTTNLSAIIANNTFLNVKRTGVIVWQGKNVNISDNVIRGNNIAIPDSTINNHGILISSNGSYSSGITNVSISDNLISDVNGRGIAIETTTGDNPTNMVIISNNTIYNAGHNAIKVQALTDSTLMKNIIIKNNFITYWNRKQTPTNYYAAGILLYNADSVTLDGNTLRGLRTKTPLIYCYNSKSNSITNNNFNCFINGDSILYFNAHNSYDYVLQNNTGLKGVYDNASSVWYFPSFRHDKKKNIAIGDNSLKTGTTGGNGIYIGSFSGFSETTGSHGIYLGTNAGYTTAGVGYQVYIGHNCGFYQTNSRYTTSYNVAIGPSSMKGSSGSAGSGNTSIGDRALYSLTNGDFNLAAGFQAGYTNTTGIRNTYIGAESGRTNSTGTGSNFIGFRAGYNETGNYKSYWAADSTSATNGMASGSKLLWYADMSNADKANHVMNIFAKTHIGSAAAPSYMLEVNGTTGTTDLVIDELAYYDGVVSNSITSEAVTVNWTNGNIQSLALTDTCTVTFTAPTGPCHLTLIITHAANTTVYPVTWPAGMKWPSATPPTMTAESEAIDIVSFLYDGTSYYGMYGNDFEAIP